MLAADPNTGRLLEPFPQIRQRAIRLFTQLAQQLGFNFWRHSAGDSMTALRNPLHLLAAQSLSGYLLGPVIADRKYFRQLAQRSLPAIIGRQQLATKIVRIGLRHISCREVQSKYSVHLMEKRSNELLPMKSKEAFSSEFSGESGKR
jgi:hypothetical protein